MHWRKSFGRTTQVPATESQLRPELPAKLLQLVKLSLHLLQCVHCTMFNTSKISSEIWLLFYCCHLATDLIWNLCKLASGQSATLLFAFCFILTLDLKRCMHIGLFCFSGLSQLSFYAAYRLEKMNFLNAYSRLDKQK